MKKFFTALVAFVAVQSPVMAVPFTYLTGVYSYTRLPDGTVRAELGGLNSTGTLQVSYTFVKTPDELAALGLTGETLDAIAGKFVTNADFIDSEFATAEGRERLSLFSFSSESYITDQGRTYIVTANGSGPGLPMVNVTASRKRISEGGKRSVVTIKISPPSHDELYVSYALGGNAQLGADYVGPTVERLARIAPGRKVFRIPISARDDSVAESAERLIVRLLDDDSSFQVGKNKSVKIVIRDND
jgi:hypothetical protein